MTEARTKLIKDIVDNSISIRRNSKDFRNRFTFKFIRNKKEYRFVLKDNEFACEVYDPENNFNYYHELVYSVVIDEKDINYFIRKNKKDGYGYSYYYYEIKEEDFYCNEYFAILTDEDLEKLLIKIQTYIIKKF